MKKDEVMKVVSQLKSDIKVLEDVISGNRDGYSISITPLTDYILYNAILLKELIK